MKIGGRTVELDRRDIVLPRADGNHIRLRLTALPIGAEDEFEQQVLMPEPPADGFARDPQTRQYITDDAGRILPRYNLRDPAYLRALRRRNRLWATFMIVQALRDDPDVAFEARRKDHDSLEAWLEAIYGEMRAAGLSMGEFSRLLDEVMSLSGLREGELEAARADFSARGASPPPGGSPMTPDAPNATGSTASGSASE